MSRIFLKCYKRRPILAYKKDQPKKSFASMMDLAQVKKYKILLSDYDSGKDLQNRRYLSELSSFEVDVLEEILFNPLTLPIRNLTRSLEVPFSELDLALQKLEKLQLFQRGQDTLHIDKEARKYFELELQRYQEDFAPDLEFFQALLKKVPIHVLPNWYAIPRTSNHIFSSLVEKQLSLPHFYERHLMEVRSEPLFAEALDLLFQAPELSISSEDLQKALHLSADELETLFIHLEFHFVAFVRFQREKDYFKKELVPLKEWKEYLSYRKKAYSYSPIQPTFFWSDSFAFSKDLKMVLTYLQSHPFEKDFSSLYPLLSVEGDPKPDNYLTKLLEKAKKLQFLEENHSNWVVTANAKEWLQEEEEQRALTLYRHPLNQLGLDTSLFTDRNLKEVEKSLSLIKPQTWTRFEEFLENALVCLGEETKVQLQKKGKHWHYQIPSYTEEEKAFIQVVIFTRLFEAGFVTIGFRGNTACFKITPFGNKLLCS